MVVQITCDSSTWEAEAGELQVQGQQRLHGCFSKQNIFTNATLIKFIFKLLLQLLAFFAFLNFWDS